jgi:monothiol glutaredoxin
VDTLEVIREQIEQNAIILYMKGSPVFPQCGFSAAVVQVLSHMGVKFKAYDVLADPEVRQGIKEFSNWPTIPQLYVRGEFVGGCDIVREMYQSGELQQLFEEKCVPTERGAAGAGASPPLRLPQLVTAQRSPTQSSIRRSDVLIGAP